jgi:type IV secretory pathway TraG/TraD family ATPase VirD4
MSSTDRFPDPHAGPLAPLEQLGAWLLSVVWHAALALSAGVIAARALRRAHLHWSWSLVGGVLCLLCRPVIGDSAFALLAAATFAAVLGRRWHREDLDAGRDLARVAARRLAPAQLPSSLLRALAPRLHSAGGASPWFRGEELVVGREPGGRPVSVPFGGSRGGTHTLVIGATGSGKTMTQSWMVVGAIERDMAAVVIDPKGERAMCESLRRAARARGRAFVAWSPEGPSVYNPFARGGSSAIADKALAGERFTEPHYLRQAQRFLGHLVRALRAAAIEPSLQEIVAHLDPAQLERLARTLPEADAGPVHAYLDSLTPRQRADLSGVRDRLAILAESDLGRWLDPRTAGAQRFDLLHALRARSVVYFNLDADSRPLLSQMLGAAIVQDLQSAVATLQGDPVPSVAVIDEFSALSVEHVVRLFGRARSAGMSLILGTQELADLRLAGRERLLQQVMGNLTTLIAHRQVLPESATLIAGLAGTRGAWRSSLRSDGSVTRTRAREALLGADDLMSLAAGWAAVSVLVRPASATVARIFTLRPR